MINKDCGLLKCIAPGGEFVKDKKYPFFCANGYSYIIPAIYRLDSYEDGTYKIIGISDELEDANFIEEVI